MTEEGTVRDLLDDSRALISERAWSQLMALVTALHPADLADLVLELETDDRELLLDHLPSEVVGTLFEFVENEELRELIRSVGLEDLPAVLEEVDADVVADVIQQLEPDEQEEALAAIDREEVTDLLQYEDESAGGVMSRGFVSLAETTTVGEAIARLRILRPPSDRAYYLYVVDADERLKGIASLRDLIVSAPTTALGEITNHDVHAVSTSTDQEEAARILQRYNLLAIPVIDDDRRLVGVMTADDLIDVLQEEATEDMFRMVGVGDEERIFSPVPLSVRRRLPWMLVNLLTAFVAAATVGLFSGTLEQAAVLALFMPVVAGMGGNAGTQTATIAVRSIAIGDLDVPDLLRACRKEILVAMVNGLAIAVVAALGAYAWKENEALASVLAIALFLNVCTATLAGVFIPLGLKAVHVDPAVAASIFVTTVTDVLGFLFFLGLGALAVEWIL